MMSDDFKQHYDNLTERFGSANVPTPGEIERAKPDYDGSEFMTFSALIERKVWDLFGNMAEGQTLFMQEVLDHLADDEILEMLETSGNLLDPDDTICGICESEITPGDIEEGNLFQTVNHGSICVICKEEHDFQSTAPHQDIWNEKYLSKIEREKFGVTGDQDYYNEENAREHYQSLEFKGQPTKDIDPKNQNSQSLWCQGDCGRHNGMCEEIKREGQQDES